MRVNKVHQSDLIRLKTEKEKIDRMPPGDKKAEKIKILENIRNMLIKWENANNFNDQHQGEKDEFEKRIPMKNTVIYEENVDKLLKKLESE